MVKHQNNVNLTIAVTAGGNTRNGPTTTVHIGHEMHHTGRILVLAVTLLAAQGDERDFSVGWRMKDDIKLELGPCGAGLTMINPYLELATTNTVSMAAWSCW